MTAGSYRYCRFDVGADRVFIKRESHLQKEAKSGLLFLINPGTWKHCFLFQIERPCQEKAVYISKVRRRLEIVILGFEEPGRPQVNHPQVDLPEVLKGSALASLRNHQLSHPSDQD